MPQHKSAAKRVRQDAKRKTRNRIHRSKMRTMLSDLRESTNKEEAEVQLKVVKAYLDRMVNKNIIHKNKAANYKSSLDRTVSSLS